MIMVEMETKYNLQRAEIRITTANLRNMHTLYKQLDLGDSDNLVFFVSNTDQGAELTGGRNTLKTELKKVMKPTQNLLYTAADHHDVLKKTQEVYTSWVFLFYNV